MRADGGRGVGAVAPRGTRAHVLLRAPWADQRLEGTNGIQSIT